MGVCQRFRVLSGIDVWLGSTRPDLSEFNAPKHSFCAKVQAPNLIISAQLSENLVSQLSRFHETMTLIPLDWFDRQLKLLNVIQEFSTAFVVFDRDAHLSFNEAVSLAEQSPMFGTRLRIIRSYPSFEVWLLYHFEPCRAPLTCAQALSRLKSVFPEFEKGNAQVAEQILQNIPKAIRNSKAAMADAVATGEFNPSTEMHILVQELIKMAV